tara:strand:+ start:1842 stop:2222 length:381 start_codon:yes stop_codon:yes gene_type:complete
MSNDQPYLKRLEEQACELLLRSPRLSVSQVLELLDISDSEFRQMLKGNTEIATLIEQRKDGCLATTPVESKECPVCHDWFVPYASARYCSDACAQTAHLRTSPDAARRLRAKYRAHQTTKARAKSE